jgi:hypothetical protein
VVGDLAQYEDKYRLCYVRGPEGILIGLAEQIASGLNMRDGRDLRKVRDQILRSGVTARPDSAVSKITPEVWDRTGRVTRQAKRYNGLGRCY